MNFCRVEDGGGVGCPALGTDTGFNSVVPTACSRMTGQGGNCTGQGGNCTTAKKLSYETGLMFGYGQWRRWEKDRHASSYKRIGFF